ncbi:MAG: heparinase II/III family protein [Planctomycetaceae bacterium]
MTTGRIRPWVVVLVGAGLTAAAPAADLPPHPRLLLTPAALEKVRDRVAADPLVALVRDAAIMSADEALTGRTCEYRIPDGKRLLGESRAAIHVVLHTALAWRLTGDRRYLDRCVKELDAACALPDWNPKHFLDTAEMATAVAFGLDWLHADLDPAARERYRAALVAQAIRPAEEVFATGGWWANVRNNWSQVCGAGIAVACAAVAKDRAALDASPFARCLVLLRGCEAFYAGGGYPEGPGYWNYGTSYHVLGLAVAADLGETVRVPPPLAASAGFMPHVLGPSGLLFNYADSPPHRDPFIAARGWLLRNIPASAEPSGADATDALAADLRRGLAALEPDLRRTGANDRFFPLHLLWLPEQPQHDPGLSWVASYGGQQPVVTMRSGTDDATAVFVAAKGGTPRASHGHMDVGSFVYDALGRRWIHDLGGDDYNLPGYFGGKRFGYFRLSSRSHNVLCIDGRLQAPTCDPCPIGDVVTTADSATATIDLGAAYRLASGPLAERVTRRVTLDRELRRVRLRDTIDSPVGDVRWQAVIDAEPLLDGTRVVLEKEGKAISLEVATTSEPLAATPIAWSVEDARPPTPAENQNAGFRILSCTVPRAPLVEIEVTITPRN